MTVEYEGKKYEVVDYATKRFHHGFNDMIYDHDGELWDEREMLGHMRERDIVLVLRPMEEEK